MRGPGAMAQGRTNTIASTMLAQGLATLGLREALAPPAFGSGAFQGRKQFRSGRPLSVSGRPLRPRAPPGFLAQSLATISGRPRFRSPESSAERWLCFVHPPGIYVNPKRSECPQRVVNQLVVRVWLPLGGRARLANMLSALESDPLVRIQSGTRMESQWVGAMPAMVRERVMRYRISNARAPLGHHTVHSPLPIVLPRQAPVPMAAGCVYASPCSAKSNTVMPWLALLLFLKPVAATNHVDGGRGNPNRARCDLQG